jgi:succinate-semialdehyde dehydrogenase/glutarate-semialdehyde dehydrogenase
MQSDQITNSTDAYRTLDPARGELIERYPWADDAGIESALGAAAKAFLDWRRHAWMARADVLRRAAALLEARALELARIMALEMGKPLAEGEAEARKCAWVCRWYAEHGESLLAPSPAESDGSEAWVRYEPLGPILAIMPWNFPFWQVFRFAAPALAAGNAAVLKHAPSTPRCALAIVDLLLAAGLPEGVFQTLFLSNEQAAQVIADRRVHGVTLTGSTRAGREVASAAGRALKPMVLELGGSDPFIVFADADLEEAVRVGVQSRCQNAGQSCIAAKRFLIEREIFEEFKEAFVASMAARKVGDPVAAGTEMGPLARADLREQLIRQVAAAQAAGADVLCGGIVPDGLGFYYPPTVLAGLPPDAAAAQEELFGPVATLYPFTGEAEALRLANGTVYGLGASLWTRDRERAHRLIPDLDSGSVFVNGLVKSDPRLPFGGAKDSGFGRELAAEGLRAFTNVKSVWVG